jgi:hypothetical protein
MSSLPIPLPQGFQPTVHPADHVRAGSVIAKLPEQMLLRERHIHLAPILHVNPRKVAKYLRKNPGDLLREGEVLAKKTSLLTEIEIVSNVTATIMRFEHATGDLLVELLDRKRQEQTMLLAPLDGIVLSCDNKQIVLSFESNLLTLRKGIGSFAKGNLFFVQSKEAEIDASYMSVEMIGNIVLGTSFTQEALVKASGMGIAGMIALRVKDEDLDWLVRKRMAIPVVEVDQETWNKLAKKTGRQVQIDVKSKTITVF